MTESSLFAELAAPFEPGRVSWRVGPTNANKTKGVALAYIDARDVMQRLDAVCGPAFWQCRYPHAGQKTVCEIGIKIGDEWIWKADGAGDSDMEAEKGALSDAFKRAAVKWGVGRYLYDMDSPWVDIVQKGRSYVIAETALRDLQKMIPGSRAVTAKPEPKLVGPRNVSTLTKEIQRFVGDVHACADADEFIGLLTNSIDLLQQLYRDKPAWWDNEGDAKGAKQRIVETCETFKLRPDSWIKKVEDQNAHQRAA